MGILLGILEILGLASAVFAVIAVCALVATRSNRYQRQVDEARMRALLGDRKPDPCKHSPEPVHLVVTGELVGHVCSKCLEPCDAPPPRPTPKTVRKPKTHDLTQTSPPVKELPLSEVREVRVIGGPRDGLTIRVMGPPPSHLEVRGELYVRVDDPDTGTLLCYSYRTHEEFEVIRAWGNAQPVRAVFRPGARASFRPGGPVRTNPGYG